MAMDSTSAIGPASIFLNTSMLSGAFAPLLWQIVWTQIVLVLEVDIGHVQALGLRNPVRGIEERLNILVGIQASINGASPYRIGPLNTCVSLSQEKPGVTVIFRPSCSTEASMSTPPRKLSLDFFVSIPILPNISGHANL